METEHDFRLILDGVDDLDPRVVDALYEAGCDDGTIAYQAGVISIAFAREAPSMKEAIASAIRDVEKAGVGARVVRVESEGPDPNGDAIGTNSVLQAIASIDPRFGDLASELLQHRNQLSPAR
jgi:hypothetical protein